MFRITGLTATLVLGALTLSACGFHLRGAVDIPPDLNPMYVEAPSGSTVRGAILRNLEISGLSQASRAADSRIVLRILGESRASRVAAVGRDGKVIARELHLRVRFDAVGPDGVQRVEAQGLDLWRTYENPDVEVLGKQLEADLIYEDLVQDAADQILERLSAALL